MLLLAPGVPSLATLVSAGLSMTGTEAAGAPADWPAAWATNRCWGPLPMALPHCLLSRALCRRSDRPWPTTTGPEHARLRASRILARTRIRVLYCAAAMRFCEEPQLQDSDEAKYGVGAPRSSPLRNARPARSIFKRLKSQTWRGLDQIRQGRSSQATRTADTLSTPH